MEWLGYLAAIMLVVVGMAGTFLPALPGLPLVLAGFFLAAWMDGFVHVGAPILIALAVLTALGLLIDFLAGVLGARATGASRQARWGAAIGGIVGLILGLAGVILGPLVGAAIGEYLARRDLLQAGKVGIGTFIGFIIGTVAKVGIGLAMLTTFAFGWWF